MATTTRRDRPSPSHSAAALPIGKKMQGNDGNMYVVTATKSGIHRWVRAAKAMSFAVKRTVYIVDNGGIPFVVQLSDDAGPGVARVLRMKRSVLVGEDEVTRDDVRNRTGELYEHWRDIKYSRVFVGLDPEEASPSMVTSMFAAVLGRRPWWWGGNSILLETAPKRYVFVGWKTYAFKTPDVIQRYVSVMGNSAVPYPYAVGTTNTYLLLEEVSLGNDEVGSAADPYNRYYHAKGKRMRSARLSGFKLLHDRHES